MKLWTEAEIRGLWPQALKELRGFQEHLVEKSAITAGQLGMALQLAGMAFDDLRTPDPKKPRFVADLSTDALTEVFDPAYSMGLNCPIGEHLGRLMAYEHLSRGGERTEPAMDALGGPDRCIHGRSRMGECAACSEDGDLEEPDTVLEAFCDAYQEGRPFDRKRLYEALRGLGYGLRKYDPKHGDAVRCARPGCGHPYERHFDPSEGDREVGCKYRGVCGCETFVDPEPGAKEQET